LYLFDKPGDICLKVQCAITELNCWREGNAIDRLWTLSSSDGPTWRPKRQRQWQHGESPGFQKCTVVTDYDI